MDVMTAAFLLALAGTAYVLTVNVLDKRFGGEGPAGGAAQEGGREVLPAKLDMLGKKLGQAFSKERTRSTAEMLRQAGLDYSVDTYRVLVAVFAVIGAMAGLAANNALRLEFVQGGALVVLCAAAGAAFMPLRARSSRKSRQEKIEATLPATLEMLAVVVEAGQSVERGIKTVGERGSGPLAEEFARADMSVTNYGYTAEAALRKMGERVGVPGVSRFVAAVCQSIAAGSSIAPVLKAQAQIASDNYYLYIQEKANKLPVKIVVVSAVFVLPLTMIVTLVPMVITLLETTSGVLG